MEYVNYRGTYPDLPLEEIVQTFRQEYNFGDRKADPKEASFDEDVDRESGR
jgi:hypothetical protein